MADIYLFDSKGYERSMSFKHSLIENFKFDKEVMLAGNIHFNENFEKVVLEKPPASKTSSAEVYLLGLVPK